MEIPGARTHMWSQVPEGRPLYYAYIDLRRIHRAPIPDIPLRLTVHTHSLLK